MERIPHITAFVYDYLRELNGATDGITTRGIVLLMGAVPDHQGLSDVLHQVALCLTTRSHTNASRARCL